jgi:UDP-GlcNAc:undecaprenyl-phosphate GlcNAc-1-phosphate transferase
MLVGLIVPAIAFAICMLLIPPLSVVCRWAGLVDKPDLHRKLHGLAIPLCGGSAVALSVLLAVVSGSVWFGWDVIELHRNGSYAIGLTLGAAAILALGLIDDRFGLRGSQKLIGQVIICSYLIYSGFSTDRVSLLGFEFELGLLTIPLSMVWLLAVINALNLIDGADGLCGTIGFIASAAFSLMAAINGHIFESMVAGAMAGALLGFLVFNFPPARVFLGDAGSMLVGLILGALAIRSSLKGVTSVALLVPATVLALPLFDSSMAILRRKLTGRSIFMVDRGHLHHNLQRSGFSGAMLVLVTAVLCAVAAGGALASVMLRSDALALVALVAVLGSLVASRIFGYAELVLLTRRLQQLVHHVLTPRPSAVQQGREHSVQLQGKRAWTNVWEAMVEYAQKHELSRLCFDLNVPWLHESFHARWSNKVSGGNMAERWTTNLPIVVNGRALGRVELVGTLRSGEVLPVLETVAELIDGLQPELERLVSDLGNPGQRPREAIVEEALSGGDVQTHRGAEPTFRRAASTVG